MSEVPIHPAAVHLPIALSMLMPFFLGGFAVAWGKGLVSRKALVLVVVLQGVLVASGVVGIRTGEMEEDRLEQAVSHEAIEHHEDDAKRFVLSTFVVFLVVLGASFLKNEKVARGLVYGAAAVSVGSALMALDAGHHGGELVYVHGAAEVRHRTPAR